MALTTDNTICSSMRYQYGWCHTTAKYKDVDSLHVPAIKFIRWKELVYLFPIKLLNYDFCDM